MRHLRKVPSIEQMQQTEGGLCCIAMLLRYYRSNETLNEIRQDLSVGRDGLALSELHSYLKKRNFETHILKVPIEQLSGMPFPAIAYWQKKQFVLITRIHGDTVTIIDPEFGRMNISVDEFEASYSGVILTAEPTERFEPIHKKTSPWIHILKDLKNKKNLLIRTILISLLAYGIQMATPLLMQVIVDTLTSGSTNIDLKICMVFALSIFVIFGITSLLQKMCLTDFQIALDNNLTKKTFHKMVSLPYSFFDSRSNGDLLFRLSSLTVIRNLLSQHIINGVIQFGYAVAIFIYLINKSLILTGLTTFLFLLNGAFILVMREKIMETNRVQLMKDTKLEAIQTETIHSMLGIKTSGIENDIWNNWKDQYRLSMKAYKQKGTILNLYSTIISLMQLIGPLVVLLFGIREFLSGRISIGESIACYSLAASFIGTSLSLFNLWNDLSMASSYLERIVEITTEEQEYIPEDPVPVTVQGDIEFRNVSFSYSKNSKPIIKNLSFTIKKGTKFAIVGPSGSGKSTITKLLLGLYKPTSGSIYYEGVDINKLDVKDLRKQIGVVPQDMSLFNRTIAENISLNNDYPLEEIQSSARIANIHDEIMAMPMNYRTMISNMGNNLSGGQRQRIVLARTILNKPNVMILDEATSSLDNINEKLVSDHFKKCGSTQIIIAHRLSTIIDADKILVLQNGTLKEIGTHNELMKMNGLYTTLYNNQNSLSA